MFEYTEKELFILGIVKDAVDEVLADINDHSLVVNNVDYYNEIDRQIDYHQSVTLILEV